MTSKEASHGFKGLECYVLDQYIVEKPAETEKKDPAKVKKIWLNARLFKNRSYIVVFCGQGLVFSIERLRSD